MPREFLALNPGICHKMLFANLLTSISCLRCFSAVCVALGWGSGWCGSVVVAQRWNEFNLLSISCEMRPSFSPVVAVILCQTANM